MGSLNILVFGDIHVERNSLDRDQIMLKNIVAIAKQMENLDVIIFLGDLGFYTDIGDYNVTSNLLYFLGELAKIKMTILIKGNHDVESSIKTDFFKKLASKKIVNLHVVNGISIFKINEIQFGCISYMDDAQDFYRNLNLLEMGSAPNRLSVIFSHATVYGTIIPNRGPPLSNKTKETIRMDAKMPLLVSGHVHEYQIIRENGGTCMYIGSAKQMWYNDDVRSHGIAVFRFTSGSQTKNINSVFRLAFDTLSPPLITLQVKFEEVFEIIKFMKDSAPRMTNVTLMINSQGKDAYLLKEELLDYLYKYYYKYKEIILEKAKYVIGVKVFIGNTCNLDIKFLCPAYLQDNDRELQFDGNPITKILEKYNEYTETQNMIERLIKNDEKIKIV